MWLLALWALSHLVYRLTAPTRKPRPLIVAHRGACPERENTLEAFARVPLLVWETDLRQTSDGVLVLMHDATVDRTTSGRGRIADLTAAEAAQLGIPTFRAFLELAEQFDAHVLPEMKGEGLEAATVAALRDFRVKATVQCFSARALGRVHELAPDLPLCRLYWRPWLGANPAGVVVVAPMAESLLLNPWMVHQAHARGWQVWPWFAALEHPLMVRFVLGLGVDGIMLDRPRR